MYVTFIAPLFAVYCQQKHKRRHKRMNKRKHKPEHNNSYFIVKALLTQAKTQMQATNTRIKMFPFPCVCTYAYAATSENKIPLRNIIQAQYWIQITSRLNSLEGSDDFACPLRLCLHLCLSR